MAGDGFSPIYSSPIPSTSNVWLLYSLRFSGATTSQRLTSKATHTNNPRGEQPSVDKVSVLWTDLSNTAPEEEGKEKCNEERTLLFVLHKLAYPKEDSGHVRKMHQEEAGLSLKQQRTVSWAAGTLTPSYCCVVFTASGCLGGFWCQCCNQAIHASLFCKEITFSSTTTKVVHTRFQCNSINNATAEGLFRPMLLREEPRLRGAAVCEAATLASWSLRAQHLSTATSMTRDNLANT